MRNHIVVGVAVVLAIGAAIAQLAQPLRAQNAFTAPEWVIKDDNGTVVGGVSAAAFRGQVEVSFHNSTHDENYTIQFRPDVIFGELTDVYYTNANCTGTAYILSPVGVNGIIGLRGSSYAIGRKVGATNEDSLVFRGTGVGADNSGILQSRFKTTTTPFCTANTTSSNTVVATQVDDLSIYTRPFRAE